jgi:hypothetical protein
MVEVNKSLTENKVKKVQIKAEEMKVRMESLRNQIDLRFDEIIEQVQDLRHEFQERYEERWEAVFQGLEVSVEALTARIGKYDAFLQEITGIQNQVSFI